MIPKTCANCSWCTLLGQDASQPVPGICCALPIDVAVQDCRVKRCGTFDMADEPRWAVPDAPPEEGQQDEFETTEEQQDGGQGVEA